MDGVRQTAGAGASNTAQSPCYPQSHWPGMQRWEKGQICKKLSFVKSKNNPSFSWWLSGNNAHLPFHLSSAPQRYRLPTHKTRDTNNKTKPKRLVADTDRLCCPKETAVLSARGPHSKTAAKGKDGNPVLAADPERLSIFVVSVSFTGNAGRGLAPLCGLLRRQPRKK